MLPIDFHQILIILPAFNEGKALEKVIRNIRRQGFIHICVVDDGSSDDTAIVAKNTDAIVLSHVLNRGAGAASQTGLSYALKKGYKQAILMDSDGQHLPEDIFRLTKIMEENQADLVIGNRFSTTQNEVPKHRIFYNNIANVFTNFFCKKNYPDTQSGFRLLNQNAMESIYLRNRGFGFCSEMLIHAEKVGLKIEFVPIQVLYTDYSMSKGQSLTEGVSTAKSILWDLIFR